MFLDSPKELCDLVLVFFVPVEAGDLFLETEICQSVLLLSVA